MVDLDDAPRRRLSTETKASFKTTEFFAYLGAVVGVLMASLLVGTEDGHDDYFRADRAWFYVVLHLRDLRADARPDCLGPADRRSCGEDHV